MDKYIKSKYQSTTDTHINKCNTEELLSQQGINIPKEKMDTENKFVAYNIKKYKKPINKRGLYSLKNHRSAN